MQRSILAGLGLIASTAGAQVTSIKLERPEATHPAEWTEIIGVRELKDGRVVVLDARDQSVKLTDFRTGTATMIGRKGNGPGEYQLPFALLALPGDSSVVYDEANSGHGLVITPRGTSGGFLPGEPDGGFLRASSQTDAVGRLYRPGSGSGTSGFAIERLNRATGKRDTVGYHQRRSGSCWAGDKPAPNAPEPKTYARARSVGPRPYLTFDQWAVAPDGRVAVVCPNPYRVIFTEADGRRFEGAEIRYQRNRVSDADKKAWMESLPQHVAQMIWNARGEKSVGYVRTGPPVTPQEWPEFLPPFVAGRGLNGAALFAPDGMLWIARTVPAAAPPTYDVIDRAGKVAFQVSLPKRSRIVGFGPSGIYVIQLDDDDLQRLQRFRFPAMNNR